MRYILTFLLSVSVLFPETIYTTGAGGRWFFKDALSVQAFNDPFIKGVACYTTYYDRSFSFTDSHKSSLSCRQTENTVIFASQKEMGNRKSVFSQSKSIFFKHTMVDRIYDAKRKVIVYLIYSKSTGEDASHHSISVVPLWSADIKVIK